MALKHFKFESIVEIDDGSVALAVNQALRQAFTDCADRPEVGKPRKVNLEISVTPVMDRGEFVYADVALQIKTAQPSKGVEVRMRANGDGLEFQPASPNNPDQKVLDLDEDDDGNAN